MIKLPHTMNGLKPYSIQKNNDQIVSYNEWAKATFYSKTRRLNCFLLFELTPALAGGKIIAINVNGLKPYSIQKNND